MNGIQYDTKMQKYIERHTTQDDNVHIVQLLRAAQDYQHEKVGSTKSTVDQPRKKGGLYNRLEYEDDDSDDDVSPVCNVMKSNKKEALTHDDEAVRQEVAEERQRQEAERMEKNKNRGMSRNEAEEMRQRMVSLEAAQNQMLAATQQQLQLLTQQQQQRQYQKGQNDYRGGFSSNGGNRNCFRCGVEGHMARDCPTNQQNAGRGGGNQSRGGYQNNNARNAAGRGNGNNNSKLPPRPGTTLRDQARDNNGQQNQRGAQGTQRPDYSKPPPAANQQRNSNVNNNYASPPSLGQVAIPPPPQQQQGNRPRNNQHTSTQVDAYGGLNPGVFPENGRYKGSDVAGRA
jgi:hypothetical protein